jgi:hypothetical protein
MAFSPLFCYRRFFYLNSIKYYVMFVIVQPAVLCSRLESNVFSLRQVTTLTMSSPVVGLLPLASGQAFNSISSVNGGMVIPP